MKRPVTAATKVYGIFGNPVTHSLSPLLHNAAFAHFGIDAVYLGFEVLPEALPMAFEGLRSLKIQGVNVTVPFKEDAMQFVDEIPEDLDRSIGAINTVVNRQGHLFGHNTDRLGFLKALEETLGITPADKTVLLLGAGGAARAVAFALAGAHAKTIVIQNRTTERAEGLRDYLDKSFPKLDFQTYAEYLDDPKRPPLDLVVNATVCGMKSAPSAPFDLETIEAG
ncbi:MAG: shikimate dehydrogenase, partial [Candidatus Omnitrophota bacterium]